MNDHLSALSKTFKKRGFQTFTCDNSEQAVELVHELISESVSIDSIGIGNSLTIKNMGLYEILLKYTKNIYIHSPIGTEDTDRKALTADIYLTSANAVSLDGHIVNIDGTGNRTAATCFGPKHVIYIVGKNKIAKSLEDALFRAKNTVAVELAKMYSRKTPCVVSRKCEDCISPDCICAVTTIHRKKPYGVNISIIFVDENLGI